MVSRNSLCVYINGTGEECIEEVVVGRVKVRRCGIMWC